MALPTEAITGDLGDVEVLQENVDSIFQTMIGDGSFQHISWFWLKILLIFMACLIGKRLILASLSRILAKTKMEKGLQIFIRNIGNVLLWLVTVFVVADALGISATPLLATFSVMGLALTLAVKDSLSNLSGGINILMSSPFVVGDYVNIGDEEGTVKEIGMVHTTLSTMDNRRIMLPNSVVMGGKVINYTAEKDRRVDIVFSTSYDTPVQEVQRVMLDMIAKEPLAYFEPAPTAYVKNYADSAIEYTLRVWCSKDDYWTLYFSILDNIKPTLDQAGIEIPYPHLNVHMQKDL